MDDRGTRPAWTAGSAESGSSSTIATPPSTGRCSGPPSSGDSERDGQTVLDGRFRMTLFARALLPVWLAPAIVCLVVALVPTQLQPQSPAFRIALALLGGLLAVMAFGRFAPEWWGRPGAVDAVSKAIRAAVPPHQPDPA